MADDPFTTKFERPVFRQEDLDELREIYSVPESVRLRLPSSDERACSYSSGELMPNGWRIMHAMMILWEEFSQGSCHLSVEDFHHYYQPKEKDSGWFYLGSGSTPWIRLLWGKPVVVALSAQPHASDEMTQMSAHVQATGDHPVWSATSLVTLEKLLAYLLGPNIASLSADASPSPRDVSPSPRDVSPSTVTSAHCFLKGRKLWRYVTGDIKAPTQGAAETSTEFIVRLEEWDTYDFPVPTETEGTWTVYQCLLASDIFYMGQLTPSEPKWLCAGDSTLFATYRDQQRLILFLMGLSDIYEPETRLGLVSTSHVATALATPGSRGRGSSGGSRSFSASGPPSSGGSASRPNESDCPNNSTRRDTRPQSTAATAGVSSTASASSTLIDISDLPALVQQIMSASGNPSTALSASTDVLFHSSYLTDPSIDLFPDDVDVPADPPDDTLHVAPPSIVYPVESSSTDLAPPVLPPAPLPSDIPARRSTRGNATAVTCRHSTLPRHAERHQILGPRNWPLLLASREPPLELAIARDLFESVESLHESEPDLNKIVKSETDYAY
ncbi:hypothetical protein Acr_28g0000950 [Actinidia rufa]|uniref:Uncharacterized protein n=1 Tax=Actinidia rufa TaxID=165716 RepID=A0A7J0H8F7_9ERIC|nr:hypothetical protein Acr_28g0000950 [Actinidia rufa]